MDQYKVIRDILGPVGPGDLGFIQDDIVEEYANQIGEIRDDITSEMKLAQFFEMFPDVDLDLIELLQGLLELDPRKRLTAS